MKQTLLITGFEPFGGETVNPSWLAVQALAEEIGAFRLVKLQIPTEFDRAAECVLKKAGECNPQVILSVGQAGGRSTVTPETVAINLRDASIPDNAGNQPVDRPILQNGDAAYFSTVPTVRMVQAIREKGLPASRSYSAGAFVCNDVFYTLLHRFHGTGTRVGFVHVPFLPEQAGESRPSMPLAQIVSALEAAIAAL